VKNVESAKTVSYYRSGQNSTHQKLSAEETGGPTRFLHRTTTALVWESSQKPGLPNSLFELINLLKVLVINIIF